MPQKRISPCVKYERKPDISCAVNETFDYLLRKFFVQVSTEEMFTTVYND
jgi:hypothetical protein